MAKLSVYIVTLNEELRLEKTLKAAKQVADEIIIVDSGSTDKTEKIAKEYGVKFVFHKWKNISSQKQYAQNLCKNDYVLWLDADEVLSPELIKEVNDAMKNPLYHVYSMKRKDMYPGDKKPKLLSRGDTLIRIYDRKIATMPDDLTNDRVVFLKEELPVKKFKNIIYHYSYVTLYQTWFKLNMYTDQLVNTMAKTGKKYSKFRLVIEMPYQFFRYYIVKRQFINGWFGFIMSVSLAYFRFLKVAKWVEYEAFQKEKDRNAQEMKIEKKVKK